MNPLPSNCVGVTWYAPETYQGILAIMQDRDDPPSRYSDWLDNAQSACSELQSEGYTIIRAHLDPEEFLIWCKERSLHIDAEARNTFTNEAVYRHVNTQTE